MTIQYVEQTPDELTHFEPLSADDPAKDLSPEQVQDIAEVFHTPLNGSYNWDYQLAENRIKKLYELGKELNWNATHDIDWSQSPNFQDRSNNHSMRAIALNENNNAFVDFPAYKVLSEEEKLEFARHMQAWTISQFLHGEQGALLVASQLASCAPTFNAKLYAASQTFDEARHVEVFTRYLREKVGLMYPITRSLKSLLDKILSDPRWDLKFIGMQIIIEGLALAALGVMREHTTDPVLKELVHLVIRDEARHVTFGVNYLESFVETLDDDEREERAQFAYEACVVMRERILATDVFRRYGWDVEQAREYALRGPIRQQFRKLIFSRVMPNLKRIGLLTDNIRPKFETLGILEFEDWPDDANTDWTELAKPLRA